jgi:putative endonuclease
VFIRLLEVADLLRHYGRRREWADGHAVGRRGEDIAQRFLQRAGMTIVARNYRMESGAGEIDLIGWDGDRLVFIEVKTRQTDEFGAPDRAIGPGKQRTMLRAARDFARHAEVAWDQVRFDIVGVILKRPPAITHFRDVLI